MPTLLAPGYLLAALVAAAGVGALHLLAWRRPTPAPLPTARFAPGASPRALVRVRRLNDPLLLALRVLALLLAGLALSRPARTPALRGVARVVVMDASRAVQRVAEVEDSARVSARGADFVSRVRVDSVARLLPDSALGARAEARGVLSAGLIVAVREARRLARTFESVEIAVVSPFARESWDAATVAIRGEWPGRVALLHVTARDSVGAAVARSRRGDAVSRGSAPDTEPATASAAAPVTAPVTAPAFSRRVPPADDPVGAAFALAPLERSARALRVRRGPPTTEDSAFASGGGVVVAWPARTGSENTGAAEVLAARDLAVSGRFVRDALAASTGDVMLRWGDGTAAVREWFTGSGCIRSAGFQPAEVGDDVLRPGMLALAAGLSAPCGDIDWTPVAPEALARLAAAPAIPATRQGGRALPPEDSLWLRRVLLLLTAAVLVVEWWMRRRAAAAARARSRAPVATSREAA
ncbi:MAG: BatA domain-containing protein [Gemmatimonadaceae bacterium]